MYVFLVHDIAVRLTEILQKHETLPETITIQNPDDWWSDKVIETAAGLEWVEMKTLTFGEVSQAPALARAPLNMVIPHTFIPNDESNITISCDVNVRPQAWKPPEKTALELVLNAMAPRVKLKGLNHNLAMISATGTLKPGFSLNIPATTTYNKFLHHVKGYNELIPNLKQDNWLKMIQAAITKDPTFEPSFPPEFDIDSDKPKLMIMLKQAIQAYENLERTFSTTVIFGNTKPAPAPIVQQVASSFLTDLDNIQLE